MDKRNINNLVFNEITEDLIKLAEGKNIIIFISALIIFQLSVIEHAFVKETVPTSVKRSIIKAYYKLYANIKRVLGPTLQ